LDVKIDLKIDNVDILITIDSIGIRPANSVNGCVINETAEEDFSKYL
jgi:hypothetical protein